MLRMALFAIPFVTVLCGLVRPLPAFDDAQDERTGSEIETAVEDDFHGLAGTWILVDKRGSLRTVEIDPLIMQVSAAGDVVTSGGQGKARKWHTRFGSQWRINPDASPKELDDVRKDLVFHRVYELRGDYLTICASNGSSLGRPKKIGFDLGMTRTVYVRGLEKGRKLLAERLAQQYSGDWDVKAVVPMDHAHWSGATQIVVRDGAFVVGKDEKERSYAFSLNPILEENIGAGNRYYPSDEDPKKHPGDRREDPLKPFVPLHMDLTIEGVVYHGVYEESNSIRFSYFADKPTERPKSVGQEGAVLVELSRVKP